MGITLTNNAHTTLSADASSTDTVIYVEDIDSFPSLDVDDYFYLTLERTSGALEIVKVTQINASSFNVVRGQENTIPISFSIGSHAKLNMTVQNITDLILTGNNIDNGAYGSDWDGDTDDAPSRNAVYDKFVSVDSTFSSYAPLAGATFTGTVTVPDDAYAAGWDGNLTVPTKNAVYDKIQTITGLSDGDKGDITVSGSGATWTIDSSTITLTKMANLNQYELIGRSSSGAGVPQAVATSANVYTLLGSANYAAFRTSLGLGTSALVDTGTSGATVPLLNGANTWSSAQLFSYDATTVFNRASTPYLLQLNIGSSAKGYIGADTNKAFIVYDSGGAERASYNNSTGAFAIAATSFTFGGNTVLTTSNGAQLAVANTFTANQTVAKASPIVTLNASASGQQNLVRGQVAGNARWIMVLGDGTTESGSNVGSDFAIYKYNDAGSLISAPFTISRATGAATFEGLVTAATIVAQVATSSETSGTLTSASANRQINATGNITFNPSVFTAGDRGEIYAGASSRTITQGTSMTLRLDGTATTGSRTLAAYGRASWYAVAHNEIVVTGVT